MKVSEFVLALEAGERMWVLFRARKLITRGKTYAEAMKQAEKDAQDVREGRKDPKGML